VVTDEKLDDVMSSIHADDICNLQLTSGTTGDPKAAMLTHRYVSRFFAPKLVVFRINLARSITNNDRFVGDRMRLSSSDAICCPFPSFHCFGLFWGLSAASLIDLLVLTPDTPILLYLASSRNQRLLLYSSFCVSLYIYREGPQ